MLNLNVGRLEIKWKKRKNVEKIKNFSVKIDDLNASKKSKFKVIKSMRNYKLKTELKKQKVGQRLVITIFFELENRKI